ncbi:MAG: glycosyltransferase family 39 protein, partial [Deltaproteobacteria bacterium]|nr:glycosyltransferase family 39 protein [Deltaproteobacteria bacterium]
MKKSFFSEKPIYGYPIEHLLIIVIISIGIIVRLANYLNNSGLGLDEASVALNLMERSYAQLLLPLDNFQVAPILFLLIEKLSVNLFGHGELALRLFPLICSILSLPVFYFLAKNLFEDKQITLTSIFVFAVAPIQLHYTVALKQYITDVFVSLFLLWLFSLFLKQSNRKLLLVLAVSGVISIFLSNISVLVLFTLSIYWLIYDFYYKKRDYTKYVVVLAWVVTFGIYYYFFIHNHKHQLFMLDYWQQNFLPLNPFRSEFWHFFNSVVLDVFAELMLYNPAGLYYELNLIILYLFLIIYGIGLIIMVKRHEMTMIVFLCFPIVLHLLLSGFKLYPFSTRLALYLSPLMIMTFSYGLIQLYKLSEKILRSRWPGIIAMVVILSFYPYKLFVNYPIKGDGARESIQFINERFQKNQKVYVYYYSKATLEYYKKTQGIRFNDAIIAGLGEGKYVKWAADLHNFEDLHGEVWLLFSHLFHRSSKEHPEKIIMNKLMERGVLLNSFQTKNSAAYL